MKTKTTGEKVADVLAAGAIALYVLAIAAGTGKAEAAEAPTGMVALAATLNNAPAFRQVKWVVRHSGTVVGQTVQHYAAIPLAPGTYEAALDCGAGNAIRTRNFTVGSTGTTHVVVACD